MFFILDELFSDRDDKGSTVERLYQVMAQAMSELALFLVQQPIEGNLYAGPTFEIYEFEDVDREAELSRLARMVVQEHPELAAVGECLAGL